MHDYVLTLICYNVHVCIHLLIYWSAKGGVHAVLDQDALAGKFSGKLF